MIKRGEARILQICLGIAADKSEARLLHICLGIAADKSEARLLQICLGIAADESHHACSSMQQLQLVMLDIDAGMYRQEMSDVQKQAESQRLELVKTHEALDAQEHQMAQVNPCSSTL